MSDFSVVRDTLLRIWDLADQAGAALIFSDFHRAAVSEMLQRVP